jgi:hypothetical protein
MCCLAVEYKAPSLPGRRQYRPPLPRMSLATRTSVVPCLAVLCSLALGGVATAAPAGDEYLPKVPNATGHDGGSGGGGGSPPTGSSSAAPSSTGGTAARTAESGEQPAKDKKRSKHDDRTVTPAASSDGGSSDGGGGSSGLLIGLLIVVGVIIAAVGMTLRQRAGGGDEAEGAGPARERGAGQGARPTTPDGEIVAGRDKG